MPSWKNVGFDTRRFHLLNRVGTEVAVGQRPHLRRAHLRRDRLQGRDRFGLVVKLLPHGLWNGFIDARGIRFSLEARVADHDNLDAIAL